MKTKMRIDSHVHITPPEIAANWEKYAELPAKLPSEKEWYFSLLSRSKVNKFASAEDVILMMEKNEIDRAVVFGFAFQDLALCRLVNDYVIDKVKEYPEKLTGFAVVPKGGMEVSKEIERCYKAGLKGVGELYPAGQEIDLKNKLENESITSVCKELDIPLLLHVNELVGHDYPGKTDVSLKQIETFVSDNVDLKIILAHWGGGIFLYESMKEIKEKFQNVYYDTAATPFIYDERIYRAAKALDLCDKILFGSDYPILPPSRYTEGLKKSGLPNEDLKLMLGENARKLLKV